MIFLFFFVPQVFQLVVVVVVVVVDDERLRQLSIPFVVEASAKSNKNCVSVIVFELRRRNNSANKTIPSFIITPKPFGKIRR